MSRDVFEYALVQAVPRAERGECLNVGVVLYCQARDFLSVSVHVDGGRLRVLDAAVDVEGVDALGRGVLVHSGEVGGDEGARGFSGQVVGADGEVHVGTLTAACFTHGSRRGAAGRLAR